MSGKAFLALWNDFDPGMTEEYEAWHGFEHVPERLTAKGMLSARRYAAFDRTENRYFTLYELESLGALQEDTYLDLVDNPSEWSARMRQHFSNVLRVPAEYAAFSGNEIGGALAVHVLPVDRAASSACIEPLAQGLQTLLTNGQILAFRIGLAEPNQPYKVFEQAQQRETGKLNIVLCLEATTRPALDAVSADITRMSKAHLGDSGYLRSGSFDLLGVYPGNNNTKQRHEMHLPALRQRFAKPLVYND
jgi:hypothetical protein